MLRRWPLPLAIAGLVAVPASAADVSVKTAGFSFSPETITIDPGDSVTWTNDDGGTHNVHFDDGSFDSPPEPTSGAWTASHSFDTPGSYRYYCELHGGPGGAGMSGKVVVRDPNAPPPSDPPGLHVATKRKRTLEQVLDGVRVRARCDGGCIVALDLLDHGRRVRGVAEDLEPGVTETIVLKPKKKARRRLRRHDEPFKLKLEAHAVNSGGDHSLERTIRVKP